MKLQIECPDDLSAVSEESKISLETLAQEALLVRLFALGRISSGKAAEILGISRREFLDLLSEYGVSVFDENIDFEAEVARGAL